MSFLRLLLRLSFLLQGSCTRGPTHVRCEHPPRISSPFTNYADSPLVTDAHSLGSLFVPMLQSTPTSHARHQHPLQTHRSPLNSGLGVDSTTRVSFEILLEPTVCKSSKIALNCHVLLHPCPSSLHTPHVFHHLLFPRNRTHPCL